MSKLHWKNKIFEFANQTQVEVYKIHGEPNEINYLINYMETPLKPGVSFKNISIHYLDSFAKITTLNEANIFNDNLKNISFRSELFKNVRNKNIGTVKNNCVKLFRFYINGVDLDDINLDKKNFLDNATVMNIKLDIDDGVTTKEFTDILRIII